MRKQEQAAQHQPGQQGPDSAAAAAAGHCDGEQTRGGWGTLRKDLLPLVASRLQGNERRDVGAARLACRQWAAELPPGLTRLDVEGKGPAGWGRRFCGLEDLTWARPVNAGESLPKLRSLCLTHCTNEELCMLKDMPGLASLKLCICKVTEAGLKELKHLSGLTSLDPGAAV